MAGLVDSIAGLVRSGMSIRAAKKAAKAAEKERQAAWDRVMGLDWSPELVSEHVGQYQKTQSPVANAYLESLIAGDNPDLTQGTRLGSDRTKLEQGISQSNTYGDWDALRARARELDKTQPYAIKDISTNKLDKPRLEA